MTGLNTRIVRASTAQGVTSLVGKVVSLLLTIVLARLLFPEDYGLFTLAMIVTGLANLLGQFGFQSYIIQAEKLTPETLNTCYTLNVAFSAALGLLIAALGLLWPNAPTLLPEMLALYGLHVFLSGLTYIELALLKRELAFGQSSRVELAYTFTSMAARVGFAAAHTGALCFPLGDVLGSLVRWLFVRRLRPSGLRLAVPQRTASREALVFGMHATSVGIASFVANQTDKMLVSTAHPMAAVGLYTFGNNAAAMFYNAFIVPQMSVFFATFARLRQDLEGARRVLLISSRLIFSFALPLNVLWLLEPQRLLEAIFGARWIPAAPLVQVFAVDYLMRSLFSGVTGLQMSFGRAADAARTKWINALVFVVFLLAATALGVDIVGYAIAYVAANFVATAHNLRVNGRIIEVNWISYASNLAAPTAIALVSTMAWAFTRDYFEPLALWPSLLGLAGTWLLTFTLLSLVFNRMMFTTPLALLRRKHTDSV